MIPCDYCAYFKEYHDSKYSPTVSEMRHLSEEEREEYESMLEEHSVSLVPERTCHDTGRWTVFWECSECGKIYEWTTPKYCPECGSKVVEE